MYPYRLYSREPAQAGSRFLIILNLKLRDAGSHRLPVCEQGFNHFPAASFGVYAQHRFGTRGPDKQPGIVGHDVLDAVNVADFGHLLTADLRRGLLYQEIGHL